MPRMLDLVKASALPSHQMMSASKGALRLPADEMLEILVYIAEHNKIFGESARMTLAGWDEASSREAAANPKIAAEILNYWLSPKNIRPALLPIMIENPAVSNTKLGGLATTLKKELLDVLIASPRIRNSQQLLQDLITNHDLNGTQAARVRALLTGERVMEEPLIEEEKHASVGETAPKPTPKPAQNASETLLQAEPQVNPTQSTDVQTTSAKPDSEESENIPAIDPEADAALTHFLTEHAKEIASQPEKPFHPIGGIHEDTVAMEEPVPITVVAAAASAGAAPAGMPPTGRPQVPHKSAAKLDGDKRDSVLQKISKLDIKGRIQLAMKGTKEERAILVRDGTKIIALAVLDSPKITDGEVEKFAGQKNVLEAVLRAIPMKRRFAKNYAIVRALVFNPRTPLDVALGLMKNLLVADLKNLSGNKEVAETVRKLALRMFRQKHEAANKK
jgi:hypothetical protein